MKKNKRKRVTIDARVQGALAVRVTLYWICCVLSFAVIVASGTLFGRGEEFWNEFSRIGTLAFLPLPLVLLDVLMFSNRIAGPVYRIRGTLDDLSREGKADPLALRNGDFYGDVAASLNRVVERYSEKSRKDLADAPNAEDEHGGKRNGLQLCGDATTVVEPSEVGAS